MKQLLSELDGEELSMWETYYSLEPFGEWRADFRNAILAKMWASKETKMEDLMPQFDKRELTVTQKQKLADAKARAMQILKEKQGGEFDSQSKPTVKHRRAGTTKRPETISRPINGLREQGEEPKG